jgi:hypothetical protein
MSKGFVVKLLVIAAILCSAAFPVLADTSASLTLSGTVAKSASITVTPAPGATNLTLTSTPSAAITVATVTEVCNSTSGYTVTVASANAGYLKGAIGGNTDAVAYVLYQNGSAVTLSAAPTTMVSASSKTTGASQTLTIDYAGDPALAADTYSDILTFTIAAL